MKYIFTYLCRLSILLIIWPIWIVLISISMLLANMLVILWEFSFKKCKFSKQEFYFPLGKVNGDPWDYNYKYYVSPKDCLTNKVTILKDELYD